VQTALSYVSENLGPGASGPAVLTLQARLSSLGYWVGTPTGEFDDATEQAVYALQKAAGLPRDGFVGPTTWIAAGNGVVPKPRSHAGRLIEVDLERDLVLFVTNGKVNAVLNTSTGGGYSYWSDGQHSVAITPTGLFRISRQIDGIVTDSLGQLWRPKYFDSGFAIHGDSSVPPTPASHGCVRVSNEAMDWVWAQNLAPIGTPVWIY
jgi:N-acetylmuramoyl-L-alanine amidase